MRYPSTTYTSICFRRSSDVRSRATEWLWTGWLPAGKLSILDGDPGLGKSLVTLDLCARLTSGRAWPDDQPSGQPCNVVVLNAEDSIEDTVRPRLEALGADLERVYFLEGVIEKDGEDTLRFPAHALALRDLVRETYAKLVVIDPFVAFLDKTVSSHNDRSVRTALRLLKAIAEEEGCAILLVRHLNKDQDKRALYRGGGSIGCVAGVRTAWLVAGDPMILGRRVLAQLKNNLQALAASLAFEVQEASSTRLALGWFRDSPHTAERLLEASRGRGRPATKRRNAAENMRLFLDEEPRTLEEVIQFAKAHKIAPRTLDRVKRELGIRSVRAHRMTFWLLPGQLPEDVTEDMLLPFETRQQEKEAFRIESERAFEELATTGRIL
jgi:hypothetical protein